VLPNLPVTSTCTASWCQEPVEGSQSVEQLKAKQVRVGCGASGHVSFAPRNGLTNQVLNHRIWGIWGVPKGNQSHGVLENAPIDIVRWFPKLETSMTSSRIFHFPLSCIFFLGAINGTIPKWWKQPLALSQKFPGALISSGAYCPGNGHQGANREMGGLGLENRRKKIRLNAGSLGGYANHHWRSQELYCRWNCQVSSKKVGSRFGLDLSQNFGTPFRPTGCDMLWWFSPSNRLRLEPWLIGSCAGVVNLPGLLGLRTDPSNGNIGNPVRNHAV
jgi:hypothetical protein